MCGRYTLVADRAEIHERFGLEPDQYGPELPPRYNVAPTQTVAVVGLKPGGTRRGLALLKWGLVPRAAPDPRPGPTNARAETVDRLPTFRDSFRRRRCLVPADGFYEWASVGGVKVPHRFTLAGGGLMALAGLWDVWRGGGDKLATCCLLTTTANPVVRPVHDRMPVILPSEAWAAWLDPATPLDAVRRLLVPFPGEMAVRPASPRVNSARNEGPELLAA